MRWLFIATGNLLILAAIGGLAIVGLMAADAPLPGLVADAPPARPVAAQQAALHAPPPVVSGPVVVAGAEAAPGTAPAGSAAEAPAATLSPFLPITRVALDRISLDAEVVQATFVEKDGGTTWEVPKHKAGHAQYTAGAGQRGNAVLLGHVESISSGNVFKDLKDVVLGDTVQVFSGGRAFVYRVVDIRTVPRSNTAVLAATERPSVSLVTCTGVWSPVLWDFTERLVVRAELVEE